MFLLKLIIPHRPYTFSTQWTLQH